MNSNPETYPLPGDWNDRCDKLRKMILIKTIRPDRVLFSAKQFVETKIGETFIKNYPWNYDDLLRDSMKYTPIIFILSPGVDPFS